MMKTTRHLEEHRPEADDLVDLGELLLGLIPDGGVYGALQQLGQTFHVHPNPEKTLLKRRGDHRDESRIWSQGTNT